MDKGIAQEILDDIKTTVSDISFLLRHEGDISFIQTKASELYALIDDFALEVGLQ